MSRGLSKIELECPVLLAVLKFIYSEKATKFCEISTLDLSCVVTVKFTVEISQNFVAFSEYMNFTGVHGVRNEDLNLSRTELSETEFLC